MANPLSKVGSLPELTAEQVELFDQWLGVMHGHVLFAQRRLKTVLKINHVDSYWKNLQYYKHAAGTTRWLRSYLAKRRKALAKKQEPTEDVAPNDAGRRRSRVRRVG